MSEISYLELSAYLHCTTNSRLHSTWLPCGWCRNHILLHPYTSVSYTPKSQYIDIHLDPQIYCWWGFPESFLAWIWKDARLCSAYLSETKHLWSSTHESLPLPLSTLRYALIRKEYGKWYYKYTLRPLSRLICPSPCSTTAYFTNWESAWENKLLPLSY